MSYILDDNLPDMMPCPFCGKEPALQKDKRYPKSAGNLLPVDAYAVVCNTFSCPIYHADNTWFTTAETAIEKWNEQKGSIPISWLESYTRLKCMDYVHSTMRVIIEAWKKTQT